MWVISNSRSSFASISLRLKSFYCQIRWNLANLLFDQLLNILSITIMVVIVCVTNGNKLLEGFMLHGTVFPSYNWSRSKLWVLLFLLSCKTRLFKVLEVFCSRYWLFDKNLFGIQPTKRTECIKKVSINFMIKIWWQLHERTILLVLFYRKIRRRMHFRLMIWLRLTTQVPFCPVCWSERSRCPTKVISCWIQCRYFWCVRRSITMMEILIPLVKCSWFCLLAQLSMSS